MLDELKKILNISYFTSKEILRSKILYGVLVLALGIILITYVAFNFTYGDATRVTLNFGLAALTFSCIGISIFMGVNLLSSEIESKTVYMLISRPIPRYYFIIGKVLGLISVLIINVLILGSVTVLVYIGAGGDFSSLIVWSIVFIASEAFIMLIITTLFSLITSNTLSVIFSILIYFSGHAINETKTLLFVQSRPFVKNLVDFYEFILPAFHKLNIKDYVVYKNDLSISFLMSNLAYSTFYFFGILIVVILVFEKKSIE
jgi:ABC-type transport system involved in multi-copper enzyme maturation permease subunit